MFHKKPILVTGAHRSGTTWVGMIISSSPKVRYVHEPFNVTRSSPKPPFTVWFQHVSSYTDKALQKKYLRYLRSFFTRSPFNFLGSKRHYKSFSHYLKDTRSRWMRRTVLKDPIALMSSEWISQNLNCDVIITIRHPAAFVASLKVKNWQFSFHNFLEQEGLMTAYLSQYSSEMEALVKESEDIVEQGILLWNCLYATVLQLQEKYAGKWMFVTHEALSANPMKEFKAIFLFLKLDWHPMVEARIRETTTPQKATNRKRDSKQNIFTWKDRLSPQEIERIKLGTQKIWRHFYTETDWDAIQ